MSDYRCHSRVSFYVVYKGFNKPEFICSFLDPQRAQDWVSGETYRYKRVSAPILGYMAKIDGIEYQISKSREGDMAEAIKDSIKLHEAFYEDEYKIGKTKGKEHAKKAKGGWYVLRGASHTGRKLVSTDQYRFKDDKTMQYARTKHLDQIIRTIVLAGTFDDRKLDGMTLDIPSGKTIKLPDLEDDVRQPDFYEDIEGSRSRSGRTPHSYWSEVVMARAKTAEWENNARQKVTDLVKKVLADE